MLKISAFYLDKQKTKKSAASFFSNKTLSRWKAEIFSIFMILDFGKPHKISAFYLDKQTSFVPKKKCGPMLLIECKFS